LSVNLTANCTANQAKLYTFNHPSVSSLASVRHNSINNRWRVHTKIWNSKHCPYWCGCCAKY
jgi:hypothetical protein